MTTTKTRISCVLFALLLTVVLFASFFVPLTTARAAGESADFSSFGAYLKSIPDFTDPLDVVYSPFTLFDMLVVLDDSAVASARRFSRSINPFTLSFTKNPDPTNLKPGYPTSNVIYPCITALTGSSSLPLYPDLFSYTNASYFIFYTLNFSGSSTFQYVPWSNLGGFTVSYYVDNMSSGVPSTIYSLDLIPFGITFGDLTLLSDDGSLVREFYLPFSISFIPSSLEQVSTDNMSSYFWQSVATFNYRFVFRFEANSSAYYDFSKYFRLDYLQSFSAYQSDSLVSLWDCERMYYAYCASGDYSKGFANGISTGLEQGYQTGYSAGESNGYSSGLSQGKIDANNTVTKTSASYTAGYSAGVNAAGQYTFGSLIGAVFDGPLNAFRSLFDFEILGVNLTGFLSALFVIALVVTILRLVLGG